MTSKKIFYITTILASFSILSLHGSVTYAEDRAEQATSSVSVTTNNINELNDQLNQDASQLD